MSFGDILCNLVMLCIYLAVGFFLISLAVTITAYGIKLLTKTINLFFPQTRRKNVPPFKVLVAKAASKLALSLEEEEEDTHAVHWTAEEKETITPPEASSEEKEEEDLIPSEEEQSSEEKKEDEPLTEDELEELASLEEED